MSTVTEERVSAKELLEETQRQQRELTHKQRRIANLLSSTKQADGSRAMQPYQAEEYRRLEADCVKLTDVVQNLQMDYVQRRTEEALERGEQTPAGPGMLWPGDGEGAVTGNGRSVKTTAATLGDAFIESKGYKSWNHGGMNQNAAVEVPVLAREYEFGNALKATLATTGLTSYMRPPETIVLGQQELTVADLFSQGQTNAPTIRHLRETSFTNAATTVAEGAAKPEATFALEEVDSAVRKIAVTAKVTDEMFADFMQVRTYINDRLPFMVRQREELQLLAGDGIAPNILGVLNVSGILTQARGADTNADAIYKGITKVRTEGFFEPDAVVIDPTNWTPIRLLKSTTGEYIWGAPYVSGPETIFGKRVVVTVNMTDNTALVGAFKRGGTVFYREGMRVETTNSNEDDFERNLITIRAEQREALVIWRSKAFATVTGLTT